MGEEFSMDGACGRVVQQAKNKAIWVLIQNKEWEKKET
jgi:hypothetical protein